MTFSRCQWTSGKAWTNRITTIEQCAPEQVRATNDTHFSRLKSGKKSKISRTTPWQNCNALKMKQQHNSNFMIYFPCYSINICIIRSTFRLNSFSSSFGADLTLEFSFSLLTHFQLIIKYRSNIMLYHNFPTLFFDDGVKAYKTVYFITWMTRWCRFLALERQISRCWKEIGCLFIIAVVEIFRRFARVSLDYHKWMVELSIRSANLVLQPY